MKNASLGTARFFPLTFIISSYKISGANGLPSMNNGPPGVSLENCIDQLIQLK